LTWLQQPNHTRNQWFKPLPPPLFIEPDEFFGLTPAQAKEQVCIEIWGNAQRPDPKTIARWLKN
jgi:hypothetical protein